MLNALCGATIEWCRGVAQSEARHVRDVEVAGSSPVAPTSFRIPINVLKPPLAPLTLTPSKYAIVLLGTPSESKLVSIHADGALSGNPGNERADALAVAASQSRNLAIDEAYEAQA